jgi:hypothetical protein
MFDNMKLTTAQTYYNLSTYYYICNNTYTTNWYYGIRYSNVSIYIYIYIYIWNDIFIIEQCQRVKFLLLKVQGQFVNIRKLYMIYVYNICSVINGQGKKRNEQWSDLLFKSLHEGVLVRLIISAFRHVTYSEICFVATKFYVLCGSSTIPPFKISIKIRRLLVYEENCNLRFVSICF